MDLFLSNNKVGKPTEQEVYLTNLEKHGYDDFDYFLQLKDEAEVLDMCSRCEISKYVHVQKILCGWLAETKRTKLENKPSTVPSTSYPFP